jgi:hypothetical protein
METLVHGQGTHLQVLMIARSKCLLFLAVLNRHSFIFPYWMHSIQMKEHKTTEALLDRFLGRVFTPLVFYYKQICCKHPNVFLDIHVQAF